MPGEGGRGSGSVSWFGSLPLTAVAGVITDAPAEDDTVRRLTDDGVPIVHT